MFGGAGQGGRQLVGLLAAFVLSGIIGLEREIAGKSAGLRTQTIVGTSAALILLVSKYGFDDVLADGIVILDRRSFRVSVFWAPESSSCAAGRCTD